MACRVPTFVNRRSTVSLVAALLLFASAGCKKDEGTRAARYLADGDRLIRAGQYREASLAYRRAAALTPASVDVVEKLADAATRSRQPALAADAWLTLAELQPENGTAQLRAASIYLLAGRYDESVARAEAAVQANGADPNARIVLGEALAGVHESARSEASLRDAIRLAPTRPEPHIALASKYWSEGNTPGAETELRLATALGPSNVPAQRALALFLMATDRERQAERSWAVVAASPGGHPFALADYFVVMGRFADAERTLSKLAGTTANRDAAQVRLSALQSARGRPDDAHRTLDAVLLDSPRYVPALFLEARLLQSEHRLSDALAVARRAIAAAPDQLDAAFLEADILAAQGDGAGSDRMFEQAAAADPESPRPYLALAGRRLAGGRERDAIKLIERAQAVAPADLETRVMLIDALARSGQRFAAIEASEAAISEWPDRPLLYLQLGRLQAVDGKLDQARAALIVALRLEPASIEVLRALAAVETSVGLKDSARGRIEERLRQRPDDPALLTMLGLLLEGENHSAGAERAFERALAIKPSDAIAANNLAWLYQEDGRLDDALHWATAASRQAKGAETSDTLGWILARRGEYREALTPLTLAAQSRPDTPLYRYHLSVVLFKIGSMSQARDELQHALESDIVFPGRPDAERLKSELDARASAAR
jgi:tetratricopeptide (TPR) repeat protein